MLLKFEHKFLGEKMAETNMKEATCEGLKVHSPNTVNIRLTRLEFNKRNIAI